MPCRDANCRCHAEIGHPRAPRKVNCLAAGEHCGTPTGYSKGGRCERCREAVRLYSTLRRERIRKTGSGKAA